MMLSRNIALVLLVVFFCIVLTLLSRAAPPAGIDPNSPTAKWFQGLKVPGSQASCCNLTDCRPVEFDIEGENYVAIIKGHRYTVPKDKIITDEESIRTNPTGSAVACYGTLAADTPEEAIFWYCFLPGAML